MGPGEGADTMTSRALGRQISGACAGRRPQDGRIGDQCGGRTRGKSCVIGGDAPDCALGRVQDAQAQGDNGGVVVRVQCVDSRTAASVISAG
jgi:hypothetical protein